MARRDKRGRIPAKRELRYGSRMSDAILLDPVLVRLKDELTRLYGPRLKQVLLYGSRARGDFREDSDYDVLVVGTDARLRPGMTATVTVRADELHDVLLAPIETVHTDARGAYVWRRGGRGVQRVAVTTGRANDFHVALTSGVQAGDALALHEPAAARSEE